MSINVKEEVAQQVADIESKIVRIETTLTHEKEYLGRLKRQASSLKAFLAEMNADANKEDSETLDAEAGAISENEPR